MINCAQIFILHTTKIFAQKYVKQIHDILYLFQSTKIDSIHFFQYIVLLSCRNVDKLFVISVFFRKNYIQISKCKQNTKMSAINRNYDVNSIYLRYCNSNLNEIDIVVIVSEHL